MKQTWLQEAQGPSPGRWQTPRTYPEKCQILRDKELRPTRRETDDKGPHAEKGEDIEDSGTDVGQRRQATGPGWAQAGRPSPFQGLVASPFDLAAIWAICSPGVESHASIHLSSAAEEQRSEGHHLGEERVEVVD
jgi:hypothetical protein